MRARVHRARALAPRAGARMLELVRCARLVLAGWPSACVAEMRGPGKPWCFTAPLPSEAVRQTILARTQKCENKGGGQELRLVLLCPSHETIGPKLLAVQLPHERLHFCLAVLNRVSQYPQNGQSGDGWPCGRG